MPPQTAKIVVDLRRPSRAKHDRAPRGIHLSEDFEQIPFHQIGKRLAQLWDPSQNIPFGLARGTSGATTV
jgi:hypothetical protein